MKRKITCLLCLCFAIPLFCMAQNSLLREYDYDAAGNRIYCKIITLRSCPATDTADSTTADASELVFEEEYYTEKIAQTEIRIYPNPTTENVTLEITGWETLHTGIFKLLSLNGQLLQEQSVHSPATTVSLAGLSKGTYILKIYINGHTEDWKIIKQ